MKLRNAVVTGLLLAAAAPAGAQRTERFTLSGREVAFYNLVGEVRSGEATGEIRVAGAASEGRPSNRLSSGSR